MSGLRLSRNGLRKDVERIADSSAHAELRILAEAILAMNDGVAVKETALRARLDSLEVRQDDSRDADWWKQ